MCSKMTIELSTIIPTPSARPPSVTDVRQRLPGEVHHCASRDYRNRNRHRNNDRRSHTAQEDEQDEHRQQGSGHHVVYNGVDGLLNELSNINNVANFHAFR